MASERQARTWKQKRINGLDEVTGSKEESLITSGPPLV